jgi:hypothetical protein
VWAISPIVKFISWAIGEIGDAIFLAEHRDDMMEVITAPWFSLIFAAIGLILIFLALQSVKQNIGETQDTGIYNDDLRNEIKIRFSRWIWKGLDSREPYIESIHEVINAGRCDISILGSQGHMLLGEVGCNATAEVSSRWLQLRVHQPITTETAKYIRSILNEPSNANIRITLQRVHLLVQALPDIPKNETVLFPVGGDELINRPS